MRAKLGAGAALLALLTALACAQLLATRRAVLQVPAEQLRSAQVLEALLTVSTQGSTYVARVGEALTTDVPDLDAVREARAALAAALARLEQVASPADRPSYRPLREAFEALDGQARGALLPGQMRHRAALDGELALVEATYEQDWTPALAVAVGAARADAARVQASTAARASGLLRLVLLLPAGLVLALLLLWGWALRPHLRALQRLGEEAQRLARGEGGVRVPVQRADELGVLGSALNRLAWQREGTAPPLPEDEGERGGTSSA
nr:MULTISPECIES: HAMP domain-containing protein [Myxococcaceae]